MQNISNDDLDSVTGGTTGAIPSHSASPITAAGSIGGSGGSGGCLSGGLLTSLNSISDSIKGLSNNNNGGLDSNTMLMFGMALAMRNRSDSNVYVNYGGGCGGGGCHGGFSYHARW